MYEPPARQEPYATKHRAEDMISIGFIYSAVVGVVAIYMFLISRQQTRHRHRSCLRDIYIKQIVQFLHSEQPTHLRARSVRSRLALAEAIYVVMSHTYGNDMEQLRTIAEQNKLARLLLRRVRLCHGAKRAHILMLLSTIPIKEEVVSKIERYIHSRDKDVRMSALTAILAAKPSVAIQTIASLEFDLSPFDTTRIIALLRRGLLPIAYEPLLASANRNLRILGLAIVRSFGIEIAERHLHKIITTEEDISVVSETIYTLASMGRPLGHTKIRERLAAMPAHKRKELCRHLTVEGYSLSAVKSLFTERESIYAESLINSYKRALARATIS